MRFLVIIALCLTIISCSSLGVATSVANGMLGNNPALTVDAQVGDREANLGTNIKKQISVDDNSGNVTMTSSSTTDSNHFNKADTVTIHEGPDWFTMVLLALGWLLPSPNEIYQEIKSWFTR